MSGFRYLADRVVWDGMHCYVAARHGESRFPYVLIAQERFGVDRCEVIHVYRRKSKAIQHAQEWDAWVPS